MAYSIIQNDNDKAYGVKSLVVNTRAEAMALPKKFSSGSDCLCLEDSSVWMLTVGDTPEERTWKEI